MNIIGKHAMPGKTTIGRSIMVANVHIHIAAHLTHCCESNVGVALIVVSQMLS